MCSRFELNADHRQLAARFNLSGAIAMPNRAEARPTDLTLVIGPGGAVAVRWGLAVDWDAKPLINARAETLAARPTFRRLLASGRVLVPATAWWEWRKNPAGDKVKTRIAPKDGGIMALAGLLDGDRFTIITREALSDLAAIHDRMPVVLAPGDEARWVDPAVSFDEARPILEREHGEGAFATAADEPPQGRLF